MLFFFYPGRGQRIAIRYHFVQEFAFHHRTRLAFGLGLEIVDLSQNAKHYLTLNLY